MKTENLLILSMLATSTLLQVAIIKYGKSKYGQRVQCSFEFQHEMLYRSITELSPETEFHLGIPFFLWCHNSHDSEDYWYHQTV